MAISKVERLVNLVIALLSTRGYITAEKIRSSVAGYSDSPSAEAFSRMFERDKNELRDLGIPLEVGRVSACGPHRGLPDQPRRLRAAAGRADPGRGGRGGRRHPAVGVARTDHRDPGRAAQAARRRRGRRSGCAPVAIASPAGVPGLRGSEDVLGILLSAIDSRPGGAVPAPAVARRAVQHAHRRAVGRGHREGPLVSGRPRPRPRRHPHLPALADRCRGHADRSGRRGHRARRCGPAQRSWLRKSPR